MSHRHQSLSLRLLFLLTAMGTILLLLSGQVAASTPEASPSTYLVVSGDTLWEIASGIATPEDDIREVIAVIKEINAMETSSIRAGQTLLLPSGR
ncbi:MAG TPA: LysM peptidoglycan-binding domain-containing protein [Acidimicrobiia bacterium]